MIEWIFEMLFNAASLSDTILENTLSEDELQKTNNEKETEQ